MTCCSETTRRCGRGEENPKDCSSQPQLQKSAKMLHGWHMACPCCRQLTIPPNLSLSIAPLLPPAHSACAGSCSMESSWQADRAGGFRGAASHSWVQQHSHSPPQVSKTSGLAWPCRCVLLQVLAVASLPAPYHGSFLWAVSCKIQDSRRTSWP